MWTEVIHAIDIDLAGKVSPGVKVSHDKVKREAEQILAGAGNSSRQFSASINRAGLLHRALTKRFVFQLSAHETASCDASFR